MPQSAYFNSQLDLLLMQYWKAFPKSKYRGNQYTLVAHTTPDEERLKKIFFVFPRDYKNTYGGIPALVLTVHQPRGSKTSLRMHLTDLISGVTRDASIRVSETKLATNRAAMDTIVKHLRAALWKLGPADPDHYAE